MIADDIRHSGTAHTVYFLLTAYIQQVRASDKSRGMPEYITRLPVCGMGDLSMRFDKLVAELDAASRQLNDKACAGIKEALHVFGTALNRLRAIEGTGAGKPAFGRSPDLQFGAPTPAQTGAGSDARAVDSA
jgi:hypothetical protein